MAVERHYAALSAQDTNALMGTVVPDDRNKTGIGILGLLDSLFLSFGSLGLDLGSLTSATVQDLKVSIVSENGDRALVKAGGLFRITTMAIEVLMRDMYDMQPADDSNWYIDLDMPESAERLARVQAVQQQKLMELLNSGQSSGDMFGDMAESLSITMNNCE